MRIISNSNKLNHSKVFQDLCREADELVLASPFCYLDFSRFAKEIATDEIHKVTFITTLTKDGPEGKIDKLISFKEEMERLTIDWEVRLDEDLHGKVYIFKKDGVPFSGIITSANLTESGMSKNHEWGCLISDKTELEGLEHELFADAPTILKADQMLQIRERVIRRLPLEVQKPHKTIIQIDDILNIYPIKEGTRIFIKPVGSTEHPIKSGNYSGVPPMHFSRKRPNSVRKGDILIAYGVGSKKIIGAFTVTSDHLNTNNENDRWPWYVHTECITPSFSNEEWCKNDDLYVTNVANDYARTYSKKVTANGGKNLNGLNFGCDKICLTEEYGKYLLSMVIEKDRAISKSKLQ